MSRIVFDDAAGDILEGVECGGAPWPVPRHMTLQEIMRVRPAWEVKQPKRQCFEPPIHGGGNL